MEKPKPVCIKCEKELHQSVCLVDNAGIGKFVYPMFSANYEKMYTGYLCDECTAKLLEKGMLLIA